MWNESQTIVISFNFYFAYSDYIGSRVGRLLAKVVLVPDMWTKSVLNLLLPWLVLNFFSDIQNLNYTSRCARFWFMGKGKVYAQKFCSTRIIRRRQSRDVHNVIGRQRIHFRCIIIDVCCTTVQLRLSQTVIQLLLKLKIYLGFFHDLPG